MLERSGSGSSMEEGGQVDGDAGVNAAKAALDRQNWNVVFREKYNGFRVRRCKFLKDLY